MPPPPHNVILFELDFHVKFPLLRLLKFLSDLKSTILGIDSGAVNLPVSGPVKSVSSLVPDENKKQLMDRFVNLTFVYKYIYS